jgi:hypothetical protein
MYFATKQQAVVNVKQERDKTIIYGMQWNAGRQEHILSFGLRLWTEGITGKKKIHLDKDERQGHSPEGVFTEPYSSSFRVLRFTCLDTECNK